MNSVTADLSEQFIPSIYFFYFHLCSIHTLLKLKIKRTTFSKESCSLRQKKHKINPLLTAGILKSINSQDKLYKTYCKLPKIHKIILLYYLILSHIKILLGEVLLLSPRI